jgi:hypothetical protein
MTPSLDAKVRALCVKKILLKGGDAYSIELNPLPVKTARVEVAIDRDQQKKRR